MFRLLLVFALLCYMHIWQRVPNPPISWKIPLYCLPLTPFFQILSTSLSCCPQPPPPLFFCCCLVSLAEWVSAPHLMHYCTQLYYGSMHIKSCYLNTRVTLLCVLCNKASIVHSVVFCWYSAWYHTHSHSHAYGWLNLAICNRY